MRFARNFLIGSIHRQQMQERIFRGMVEKMEKAEAMEINAVCKKPEELAAAVKNKEESIEIIGDLKNKIIRIKATGKTAWGVCAVALVGAIGFYLAAQTAAETTPAGGAVSATAGVAATAVAADILGSAAIAAVTIGVAGGGIGILNTLRDKYEIVEKDKEHIKLKRK